MRDRLLSLTGGLVRLVLVSIAFLLAIGSVGLTTVRGFCPDTTSAAGIAIAAPTALTLATVVDTDDGGDTEGDGGTESDVGGGQDATSTEDQPAGGGSTAGDEGEGEDGACPDGASRCLPPLLSSVLLVGDPVCNEQAGAELRATLVPALVGSTVLFAAAWGLRPGGRVDQLLRR